MNYPADNIRITVHAEQRVSERLTPVLSAVTGRDPAEWLKAVVANDPVTKTLAQGEYRVRTAVTNAEVQIVCCRFPKRIDILTVIVKYAALESTPAPSLETTPASTSKG